MISKYGVNSGFFSKLRHEHINLSKYGVNATLYALTLTLPSTRRKGPCERKYNNGPEVTTVISTFTPANDNGT